VAVAELTELDIVIWSFSLFSLVTSC